mmetsp:Transcript_35194/g.51614  ORF Transcript_35194/g.51614 Transcript_35194/m.51614 type:complete len:478 (-) Transcript_35194:349-1782(-)
MMRLQLSNFCQRQLGSSIAKMKEVDSNTAMHLFALKLLLHSSDAIRTNDIHASSPAIISAHQAFPVEENGIEQLHSNGGGVSHGDLENILARLDSISKSTNACESQVGMVQATLLGIEKHVLSLDIRFSHLEVREQKRYASSMQCSPTDMPTNSKSLRFLGDKKMQRHTHHHLTTPYLNPGQPTADLNEDGRSNNCRSKGHDFDQSIQPARKGEQGQLEKPGSQRLLIKSPAIQEKHEHGQNFVSPRIGEEKGSRHNGKGGGGEKARDRLLGREQLPVTLQRGRGGAAEVILVPENKRASANAPDTDLKTGNSLRASNSAGRNTSTQNMQHSGAVLRVSPERPLLGKWNAMLGLQPSTPSTYGNFTANAADVRTQHRPIPQKEREPMLSTMHTDNETWSEQALAHLYGTSSTPQQKVLAASAELHRSILEEGASSEAGLSEEAHTEGTGEERHSATRAAGGAGGAREGGGKKGKTLR